MEADGMVNKVHLIGHSMGGQTIRMLAQLLAKGSHGAPVEEDPESHDLFADDKDWVHSVTTVSTPNQGARLADNMLATNANFVTNRIVKLFAILDMAGARGDDFYDAKLDQWGVSVKADDEALHAYFDRVFASAIFDPECKDLAAWSLSTEGTKEENAWVSTLGNVFYFSYATSDSHPSRTVCVFGERVHHPNVSTMPMTDWTDRIMLGGRGMLTHELTEDWQENDGVVNTVSMLKCTRGEYVEYNGMARRGVWNGMPKVENTSHIVLLCRHTWIDGPAGSTNPHFSPARLPNKCYADWSGSVDKRDDMLRRLNRIEAMILGRRENQIEAELPLVLTAKPSPEGSEWNPGDGVAGSSDRSPLSEAHAGTPTSPFAASLSAIVASEHPADAKEPDGDEPMRMAASASCQAPWSRSCREFCPLSPTRG